MSELLLPIGGGGGSSSDELSATKANVLSGKTAVTKDSDDEAVVGTMPDNSTTTSNGTVPGINSSYPNVPTRESENLQYNVDTNGVKRINMEPPKGYYPGGGGSYIDRPASDFGDAAAYQVLSGVRFTSENGLNIQGSIIDRGTNQYGNFGEGSDYYAINGLPQGYYKSNGFSWAPEARVNKTTLRNALGIRADIIRSGYSIAGVAGTLSVQSAISFSAAATSYNTIRISWKNPAKGPWQGVFIQMSTSGTPGTGGGSRVYTGKGNNVSANGNNYVDITGLSANTTYYFTCTSYVDALGWGTSYNVNATTLGSVESILSPFLRFINNGGGARLIVEVYTQPGFSTAYYANNVTLNGNYISSDAFVYTKGLSGSTNKFVITHNNGDKKDKSPSLEALNRLKSTVKRFRLTSDTGYADSIKDFGITDITCPSYESSSGITLLQIYFDANYKISSKSKFSGYFY